ncbi:MAG: hypothetical protein ACK5PP_15995 [Acidimicrobiales bacterium]
MVIPDPIAPAAGAGDDEPAGRRRRAGDLVAVVVGPPPPVGDPGRRSEEVTDLLARFRRSDDVTVTEPGRGRSEPRGAVPGVTVTIGGLLTVRDGHRVAERVRAVMGDGAACGLAVGRSDDDLEDLAALAALARRRAAPATVEQAGPSDRAELVRRRELVAALIALFEADPAGAVDLRLQPIVELATGRLHRVAVRPRWAHPRRRNLDMARFADLLDEAGVATGWTDLVIDRARAWLVDRGRAAPPLLVPVPAGQLERAIARRGRERRAGVTDQIEFEARPGADGCWHPADLAVVAAGEVCGAAPLVADRGGIVDPFPASTLILGAELTAGLVAGEAGSQALVAAGRAAVRSGPDGPDVMARGVQETEDAGVLAALGIGLGQGFGLGRAVDAARWGTSGGV